jgi:hypothetical protein
MEKSYRLFNSLIGLSADSFPTEKSAKWNALNQRDNNPLLNDPELTDSERFVEVVLVPSQMTEAERKAWQPAFKSAW